jgi:4-amino-4-deoxy-L-arabinose transferase-like glycosyltransferase
MDRRLLAAIGFLLAVAMGLAWALPAPSSDTRELLSWGLNPGLTSPKQPPLMSWMGALVMRLAWPTTFWCVCLNQALNAAGLYYVYRTLRLWSTREPAGLWTLWLAGSVYFIAAPVAFALNADVLQFPFWAALMFHALRAFATRGWRHWIALALAFALAFYAKYTVLLFVAALAVATLGVPAYRRVWREPRLYAAALLGAALVAPHLLVLPRSGALGHATGVVLLDAGLDYRLRNLGELALGFVAYLAPAWLWLAAGGVRGEILRAPACDEPARFVRATAGASVALLAVLVLGFGFKYPSRYDSPFLFLVWIAGASLLRFDDARLAAMRRWMTRAPLGFAAVALVGGVVVYGVATHHPRQQEPLFEAAARLQAQWSARYACGPAYVMGDFWSAYGLGISFVPPRPGVHLIEIDGDPGYDPARREAQGAIVIYRDRLDAREIHETFPALDLSRPERLTLPFARARDGATITYEYLFIPPRGC